MRSPHTLAAGIAMLAVFAVSGACAKNATPPAATNQATAPAPAQGPPITQIAADLPLLPPGIVNAARPVAMTKAAYEFAARHPEVMRYVPCFCGCERAGHQGNHDCFVAGRDEADRVTAWESHGIGCQVCIDVGYQAMLLHSRGSSVVEIRAAIEELYAGATLHTPTPMPPTGGGHPNTP